MLDFRYLKAFELTAKYSSFSKAALELNIAQSAVSRQIKLLENSLGIDLIIRSSKKVMLTDKGRELLQSLIQFEKNSSDIFEREDLHPLSIGILEGLLKNWFTPILTEYLKKEKRNVNLQVVDLPILKSGIEDGSFDVDILIKIAKAIIKEYKVDKFNVLGFSFGSYLALLIANIYKDRVKKIVLVSPVINSSMAKKSADGLKILVLRYTGLYFLVKPYIYHRFRKYSQPLIEQGIPEQFIYLYKRMMEGIQTKYVFRSIYYLFFSDNIQLLKDVADKDILIVNSKTETPYLRRQSWYVRQILENEKSLYLKGNHEDFILYPQKKVVSKIVKFLTT